MSKPCSLTCMPHIVAAMGMCEYTNTQLHLVKNSAVCYFTVVCTHTSAHSWNLGLLCLDRSKHFLFCWKKLTLVYVHNKILLTWSSDEATAYRVYYVAVGKY